jgi:Domain of unknown function (DUF4388)
LDQRREQGPLDTRDARATFSGDLSEVALVDLVQTLEMGRRTGTLRLTDRAGRVATVWLREGRVVDCELGGARGELAFYRLLRWTEGDFAVEFEPETHSARITASTQALVMEGLRRADAWRRATEQLPDLGAVVEIDYRLLSERLAEIPDDVNGLLSLIDGRRTLGGVIEEAGADELAAAAMLARLFAEELVRLAPERPPQAPVTSPAGTPEPERVTWFAGPSDAGALTAPGPRPSPPPAVPAAPPAPAAPAADEPAPPRIVRFPPRERGAIPTPRPGSGPAPTGAERPAAPGREPPSVATPPAGATPAAVASSPAARPHPPASPAPRGRRALLALALAVVAVAAGAAWKRWRAEAVGGGGEYAARLGEARQDRAAGRLAAAIAGYRQALALLDTSGVEAELGSALREAAQPVAAIDALRRAVELDAANAAAYIALGEVYLGERRPADARWAFERYLSLEPQGGRAPEVRAALERMK